MHEKPRRPNKAPLHGPSEYPERHTGSMSVEQSVRRQSTHNRLHAFLVSNGRDSLRMRAMKKLLSPKEVGELLGLSARSALHIMRTQMKTIQTGRNPNNPRYKVTEEELEAWRLRSSRIAEPPRVFIDPPKVMRKATKNHLERKAYA